MKRHQVLLIAFFFLIISGNTTFGQAKKPEVLLRVDDVGMNHSTNMALEDLCKTGIPFSATVMFACPWYQEAVDILKKYPQVDVGVHLTLTSEWRYYRWGPILGKSGVPSLVDSLGYFFQNEKEFLSNPIVLDEVEQELTAQIERASKSGIKITFIDPHMGVSLSTKELQAITEKLAKKYNLGISTLNSETNYGEAYKDMWAVPIERKKEEFLNHLNHNLEEDTPNLLILHIARNNPEMEILEMNDFLERQNGIPMAGKHRQAELDMLLSPDFHNLVDKKFTLITYEQLINRKEK